MRPRPKQNVGDVRMDELMQGTSVGVPNNNNNNNNKNINIKTSPRASAVGDAIWIPVQHNQEGAVNQCHVHRDEMTEFIISCGLRDRHSIAT